MSVAKRFVLLFVLICVLLAVPAPFALADEAEHEVMNVLALGLDSGTTDGLLKTLPDTHTDLILLIHIDKTDGTIDLISIPRDTFVHVPGVRGVYKINAALNCGGGVTESGFRKTCETVSRVLGGVTIDNYMAFDFSSLVKFIDDIGGVEYDLEMSFTGHSKGRKYEKGLQLLDGRGVLDYMRARKNATIGAKRDSSRIQRQQKMLRVIYEKLLDENLINQFSVIMDALGSAYTDITIQDALEIIKAMTALDTDALETHTLATSSIYTMGWSFAFIKEEKRVELLAEVLGVEASPLDYSTRAYANWARKSGFAAMKSLYTATLFSEALEAQSAPTDDAEGYRAALATFADNLEAARAACDKAALSLKSDDTSAMNKAVKALKQSAEDVAARIGFSGKLAWDVEKDWTRDVGVNEIFVDFR